MGSEAAPKGACQPTGRPHERMCHGTPTIIKIMSMYNTYLQMFSFLFLASVSISLSLFQRHHAEPNFSFFPHTSNLEQPEHFLTTKTRPLPRKWQSPHFSFPS